MSIAFSFPLPLPFSLSFLNASRMLGAAALGGASGVASSLSASAAAGFFLGRPALDLGLSDVPGARPKRVDCLSEEEVEDLAGFDSRTKGKVKK
jgi:hypothetical protein